MTLPLVTILDDEPAIRSILADALQEAGFRTMSFARATEFEAALKSTTPDVCLVDRASGKHAPPKIRATPPILPVGQRILIAMR